LCDSPRNYSDEQLRAIAESGGVIGIFFSKKFITGKGMPALISNVVSHIQHIRKIASDDCVALGTDFGGIISGFPERLSSVSELPNLFSALRDEGFTEEMIEKICHKNAERVLKAYL
jgi:membrane dipeptidase